MKQAGKQDHSPIVQEPSSELVQEEVKPLSDPSHKLSDHLIESSDETPVSSSLDKPSHTLEDHIAEEMASKAMDSTVQK